MFSIIIPLYNKEKYVAKAIRSIRDQSFQNFEIIVVDDGSTDDSLTVVNSLHDKRLKIIRNDLKGVSSARNKGVENASYKLIAFLDADDWWEPFFLERMSKLILDFDNAAIYGCGYWIIKNGNRISPNIGIPKSFERGYIDYVKTYAETFYAPINCSFVIINKAIFQACGGFNIELKYGEDFDLWIRIAKNHNVAYDKSPLAFSNQDVEAANRALNGKLWDTKDNFIFNMDYLEIDELSNPSLKYLMDGLRVRVLLRYYLSNEWRDDCQMLLDRIQFRNQDVYYRIIYSSPRILVKLYFRILNSVYRLKMKLKVAL